MSHPPRSNRGHRERNGDHRHYQDPHDDRHPTPDRSSSRPPYYPREADPPPKHVRPEAPRVEHHDSKCTNICSRRGIVLICTVLTNALVLICLVAAHMVSSGLSGAGGALGGFNINSHFNLQGTELQRARELDMQYGQLRAPALYGGLPFTLTFGVVSLLFVVSGGKPPHRTSRGLLWGALAFQAVGALAYVAAVGLYLHFVMGVNATQVCRERERLYARAGYTWMSCEVSGGDAAVALFGLVTAVLYGVGTALAVQTVRRVRRYLEERKRREAERHTGPPQRAPLRAETTAV